MLNNLRKLPITSFKALTIICSSWLLYSPAHALEVTGGQFIQTVYPKELETSSTFSVNDFFDDQALSTRLRNDLNNDIVMGPPPLATNSFSYSLHGTNFVSGHPYRVPGINSFPSQFEFDTSDIMQNAGHSRIGLGGVMRFDLPPRADGTPRYFMMGDWTLEYDTSRTQDYNFSDDVNKPVHPDEHQVSGWFMRNHIDFPTVAFDITRHTVMSNSDAFYLSGELAWSAEMTSAFLPETELYRPISKFVMCAQDEAALAAQEVAPIPCVFPQISVNGQSGNVHISAPERIKLAVDLGIASRKKHSKADYFVAFTHQDSLYWLGQDFKWTTSATATYQGALIDFRAFPLPSPAQAIDSLDPGTELTIYFGVDTQQNGRFDPPYRFSSVTLTID